MKTRNFGLSLALAALLCALTAAPALAVPILELELSNAPTTLPRHEEQMTYEATVKNVAAESIEVGSTLTCSGTIEDGETWSGNPAPSFEIEWLRNGEPISGSKGPAASAKHYTIVEADKGKSLQCMLFAINDPDGAGSVHGSVVNAQVSLSPLVVAPVPPSAPPSGSSRPSVSGPLLAVPSGTATVTESSKVITDVVTTEGAGTFTNGSTVVEGVTASLSTFEALQAVSGSCVAPETTISKVEEPTSGVLKMTLSNPATCSGAGTLEAGAQPFGPGQVVSGECIPPGAKIVKATNQLGGSPTERFIEIDQAATCSKAEVVISATATLTCQAPSDWTAGTPITWSFQWLRNGTPIPGATSATYTVQSADTKPFSILQCKAIAEDAEGNKAASVSHLSTTLPDPPDPHIAPVGPAPTIALANQTLGLVTLEIELPPGQQNYIFKTNAIGKGWVCDILQALGGANTKATCTREDALQPGDSYPTLTIEAALGADAPEVGAAVATVSGGGALAPATDEAIHTFTPGLSFGLLTGSFEAGVFDEADEVDTRAGAHPYRGYSTFGFNVNSQTGAPIGNIKDVVVDVPRGFGGNATASPQLCATVEEAVLASCPAGSVVGGIDIFTQAFDYPNVPIFSIEPEFGAAAQFSFIPAGLAPYTFVPELRADEGYAISFRTAPIITFPGITGSTVDLCDFGAKLKGSGGSATFSECREATEPGANQVPLFTNPTRCTGPPPVSRLRIDSWQNPTDIKTYDFVGPPITECEEVKFEPEATLEPTNRQADSPTGLEVEFEMPTDGLLSPTGISQANLNNAIVTFPKGMTINPATADGLGACTLARVQLKTNLPHQCPDSSKVGVIEIDTPLIRDTLTGAVYVAAQNDNPFNETLGLYMVFSSARDGVIIKIAGKLETDPATGQLVSTFTENPEAPFSRLSLKFNSGPRAPLINPPKCGTYAIRAEFSPWSAVNPANPTPDEIVTDDSTYKVNRGPNNGACPKGELAPKLKAGTLDPTAGAKSPFVLSLSRADGTQRFTGVEVANPKGLTAYLKGVATCPESSLANVSPAEQAGALEIANPSCPANSLVGVAEAGSGAGPQPFYVKTGKVYLAGPYKGAPISLAVVTPAVAGPYDFGNVLIRTPLYIDPTTAQVRAVSDPIPLSVHGIALNIRDIRVSLNRPNFTANPTSCEPSSVDATVKGAEGATATVSDRFQAAGCENLGFKPKLSFRLFGGTKRGAHPKFRAILRARPGDANVAAASVALPRSEFLDQAHIRTVCTRVQFAADACPPGSIYGEATATTPLLDHPVSGPAYLRSSSNELPDLVVALKGPEGQPIEVELAGRVDSVNGGIRSSFEVVPDQPVSSFTLTMQGGKKGLLVNSRDLCKGKPQRATAEFTAQNGKELMLRPKLKNACKSSARKGKKGKKPPKRR